MTELIQRIIKSQDEFSTVSHLSLVSGMVPLCFALPKFKRLTAELKLMAVYLMLAIIFTAITHTMSAFKMNNLNVITLFTWIETFTFCYIFSKWSNSKIAFKLAMSGFLFFSLYFILSFKVGHFNTPMEVFEGLMVGSLAAFLLFKISINTNDIIYKDYRFWFTAPTLLLLGINIVTLGILNQLHAIYPKLVIFNDIIYSSISIFTHCLFAYGFVCYQRKMKSY